jgi:uncharacterized DUF497 family protein
MADLEARRSGRLAGRSVREACELLAFLLSAESYEVLQVRILGQSHRICTWAAGPPPDVHRSERTLDGHPPLAYTLSARVAWDEIKNVANQRKHGVSFEEAKELFVSRVDYLEIFDDVNSDFEDRFIAIGPISRGLVLIVWTERDEDTIRIISARWATKHEQDLYHNYLKENQ